MTSNILYNVDIGFDTVPALPLDEIPKKKADDRKKNTISFTFNPSIQL